MMINNEYQKSYGQDEIERTNRILMDNAEKKATILFRDRGISPTPEEYRKAVARFREGFRQ